MSVVGDRETAPAQGFPTTTRLRRCASGWSRPIRRGPAASGRSRGTCVRRCSGADGVAAVDLVAIVREDDAVQADEVVTRIHQDQRGDYAAAARVLERRGDDVVVIQHEYGIFGGHEGAHILSLAAELRQPMVLTLAHGPVGAVGPPGRDAARALRPGGAGVRVHRDGAADDPRRAAGAARARPRGAARRADGAAPAGRRRAPAAPDGASARTRSGPTARCSRRSA